MQDSWRRRGVGGHLGPVWHGMALTHSHALLRHHTPSIVVLCWQATSAGTFPVPSCLPPSLPPTYPVIKTLIQYQLPFSLLMIFSTKRLGTGGRGGGGDRCGTCSTGTAFTAFSHCATVASTTAANSARQTGHDERCGGGGLPVFFSENATNPLTNSWREMSGMLACGGTCVIERGIY